MKTGTIKEFMDKAGPLGQCVSSALAPIAPQPPLQGHTEPYARLCPVNTVSRTSPARLPLRYSPLRPARFAAGKRGKKCKRK